MLNNPVILVASDNKSTNEIIQTQLPEFTGLIIPEDLESLLRAYRQHSPQVIILGYDRLDKCEQVYNHLYPTELDQNPARKPHRVIALCNKHEVKQAYDLCSCNRFSDYIVFWPLTYDPLRLAMSVHQSMIDLCHNHNAQESDRILVRQQQNIGKLEQVFDQHDTQGRGYSHQVDSQMSSLIHLLTETLGHYDQLVNRVLDQTSAQLAEHPPQHSFSDVRDRLEHSVREVQEVRQLSHQFTKSLDQIKQELHSLASRRQPDSKRILVVDDDDFQRKVLSSILVSEGYDPDFAASGEDALESIRHSRPNLILMDILMPGMDGLEATRQIKADPALAAVPIIIISGQNQRETVLECVTSGAADYIVKPYNKATLISKIEEALTAGADRSTARKPV